jgi:hypothetical protein
MDHHRPNNPVILAFALSTWGVGIAVIEGRDTLVDWGMKATKGDKNAAAVSELKKLIVQYRPSVFVIEDAHNQESARSSRIRLLAKRLRAEAANAKVRTVSLPRQQIRKMFFEDGIGTKDALAGVIAAKFPEELGRLLPPKRKAWMNEPFNMAIFEAVAVAIAFGKVAKE